MKKHHVAVAFILGWLFSMLFSPNIVLGMAKGVVAPANA